MLFRLCPPSGLMWRASVSRRPLAPVTVLKLRKACWEWLCPHLTIAAGSSRAHLFITILWCPVVSSSGFISAAGLGSPGSSWRKDSQVVNETVLRFSLGKLRKEGNIPPAFSFSFFKLWEVAGKYPHELKNRVTARDSIVFKSYVMWLEVESFLLTIFYIETLYITFLCVEFF